MKKLLSILLAISCVLSLCACGGNNAAPTETTAAPAVSTQPTETTAPPETTVPPTTVPPTQAPLITGWFGMNLIMPEFDWAHGYPYVICLSLFILLVEILFFRWRKWF